MKLLKNNSLINLQQGIELVVQGLQRSKFGEAVRSTFSKPIYCFHLDKQKGKACFFVSHANNFIDSH